MTEARALSRFVSTCGSFRPERLAKAKPGVKENGDIRKGARAAGYVNSSAGSGRIPDCARRDII